MKPQILLPSVPEWMKHCIMNYPTWNLFLSKVLMKSYKIFFKRLKCWFLHTAKKISQKCEMTFNVIIVTLVTGYLIVSKFDRQVVENQNVIVT